MSLTTKTTMVGGEGNPLRRPSAKIRDMMGSDRGKAKKKLMGGENNPEEGQREAHRYCQGPGGEEGVGG